MIVGCSARSISAHTAQAFFLPFFFGFGSVVGGANASAAAAAFCCGVRPVARTSRYHSLLGIPFGRGVGGFGARGFGTGFAFFAVPPFGFDPT